MPCWKLLLPVNSVDLRINTCAALQRTIRSKNVNFPFVFSIKIKIRNAHMSVCVCALSMIVIAVIYIAWRN